jgi:hypothetical protein
LCRQSLQRCAVVERASDAPVGYLTCRAVRIRIENGDTIAHAACL